MKLKAPLSIFYSSDVMRDAILLLLRPRATVNFVVSLCFSAGGWAHDKGGHAIMLVFERTGEDVFSLTVCNSGDGLGFHPSSAEGFHPKVKQRTALHFAGLSRTTVVDPATAFFLLKLRHKTVSNLLVEGKKKRAERMYILTRSV